MKVDINLHVSCTVHTGPSHLSIQDTSPVQRVVFLDSVVTQGKRHLEEDPAPTARVARGRSSQASAHYWRKALQAAPPLTLRPPTRLLKALASHSAASLPCLSPPEPSSPSDMHWAGLSSDNPWAVYPSGCPTGLKVSDLCVGSPAVHCPRLSQKSWPDRCSASRRLSPKHFQGPLKF